jgi:uncharacterized protein (TIGR00255 family)
MTGYGKSANEFTGKKITVEIKSVNSKSLALRTNVPPEYRAKEIEFRSLIKDNLDRGKVDCTIQIEPADGNDNVNLNTKAIKNYVSAFKNLGLGGIDTSDDAKLLEIAMKQRDAIADEDIEIEAGELETVLKTVEEAAKNLIDFRESEGSALKKDFDTRISNIAELLQKVIEIDPQREEELRERMQKAVSELKENVDENRFEQELVFYLEKYDITEEKIRLAKHLEYFTETLETKGSNGKKLNFISQEIGREINTIGSKANFVPMQKCVVQMKDELEKIKEQILNVL